MSTTEPSSSRRGGLANVADVIIAPSAAFERLRVVPSWGWAFLVAALLAIAGALLTTPAVMHALETGLPAQLAANPAIAKLPPDQQQKQIAAMLGISKAISQWSWLAVPIILLVVGLVQGLIMTIANAAGRGDGGFKTFFALSITVGVVGYGLHALVLGIIATVKGASTFENTASVYAAVPSLALLAPGAHGAAAGFLAGLNVFSLWATVLLALGMTIVGRIPRAVAWATAVLMLLIAAAFTAYSAAQNG